jgi:hypothetical protein
MNGKCVAPSLTLPRFTGEGTGVVEGTGMGEGTGVAEGTEVGEGTVGPRSSPIPSPVKRGRVREGAFL